MYLIRLFGSSSTDVEGMAYICNPAVLLVLLEACLGDHDISCRRPSSPSRVFLHHDFPSVNCMKNGGESRPGCLQLIPTWILDLRNGTALKPRGIQAGFLEQDF